MSKYTRKAIVEAFMKLLQKKSLDKITVKEVVELAEINRNTFYYYFQDIYDLLEYMFQEEADRFLYESKPDSTIEEEYQRLAAFFYEHKDIIVHVYQTKSRAVLINYLEKGACHFISRLVEKAAAGTKLSKEGLEYITYYYTYGLIGMTMQWIEKQMPDFKDSIIRMISVSFEDTIDVMIRSYIKEHPVECQ